MDYIIVGAEGTERALSGEVFYREERGIFYSDHDV